MEDAGALSSLAALRRYSAILILVPALVVAVIVGAVVRNVIVSGYARMNAASMNGQVTGSYQPADFANPAAADDTQFERVIGNLVRQGVLTKVTLLTADGRILFTSDEPSAQGSPRALAPEEEKALAGRLTAHLDHRGAESQLHFWAPVRFGETAEPVGVVIALRQAGFIEQSARRTVLLLALPVVLGSLLAYILVWWLIKRAEREILASQATVRQVNRRLELSLVHLERHSVGTLQALTEAVDAKDSYTAAHSLGVADYASAIARKLGMDDEVLTLERAGLLHDIGKIGIPESILLKPDALTPDEFEQIKEHSVMGARIIESMPFLKDVVIPVLYHHERWDGTGYPDGLTGDEAPIGARILAVADAFDAMTTDRPYNSAKSIAAACEQLRIGRGTQLDPELVDVMLGLVDEGVVAKS